MATIDLSRFDVQVNPLAVDKQVFNDQGAASYKALANIGHGVNKIATEMYAKHMDVFTDREALAGEEKYKLSIAQKQKETLLNIDEDTDLVKGTDQTYEEYMADYITSERTRIGDTLTETQSRNKFGFAVTPLMTNDLRDTTFKSAEITSKNTLTRAPKKYSEASNIVLGSDALSVQRNLNSAIADSDQYVKMVEKTSGLSVAQKVRRDGTTSLVKSAMEASLRNIATGNDAASLDFSSMLGVGTMFKTKAGYKKFIMQSYADTAIDSDDLEKKAEAIASADFPIDTNARLATGHPEINLLSPEEKASYLKRALDTKFKIKAEAEDAIALKMSDWKAHPSRDGATAADIPAWIAEGARNMTNPGYKGDNTTRIRDAYEAADMQVVQDSVTNELTKGRTGFDDFLATSNARRDAYVKAILVGQGVMTEKEFQDAKLKDPSVGDKYALGAEKALRAKQAEINVKAARDPLYFVQSIPENNAIAAQAVRVVNGKIVVDPTNLALLEANTQDKMKQVGTLASALESANIIPSGQLNDIATVLQLSSPAEQIEVYKRLNQSPKIAFSMYSQMVKQNKMTPEQAALASNLSMGDSKTADALNSNLISLRNKYTKDARVQLIEGMEAEGFLYNTKYKDIKEMTEKAIGNSTYMQGLKKVARTSGMTDAEINNIYQNDAIQVMVLDKLSRIFNEDDSAWSNLAGGVNRKVERATEEVIQEYYGSRIKPINSANLNVITLPEGVDENKVSARATELSKTIKEELKTGRLQVDFADYQGMQKAKKYATLSQDMRQKFWLRDVAEDISFNGTDVTGKAQEIVAMFKDTNGQYYRLKLKTPEGKSFVPVIKNVRELQNSDAGALHTKYFSQGVHTPQLKAPTPRSIRPAPNTKVNAGNIADEVMGQVSGANNHTVAANFLKKEEGMVASPTDDNYGNMAVGHGHTPLAGEKFDKPLSAAEADKLLIADIAKHQGGVMKKLKVPVNENEKAALTSLAFNKGANADAVENIVNLINAGRRKEAAKEFLKYGKVKNKKTGEVSEDLLARRKREKELFETPVKKKGK